MPVITNLGPDAASGITVWEPLTNGLAYVTNAVSQGAYSQASGVWTVGTLGAGSSATLAITARIATNTADTAITNRAAITASSLPDPVTSNNAATAAIAVSGLRAIKTSNATNPTYPGSNVTYTIVVSNIGRTAQGSIAVTDAVPDGVTYVTGSVRVVTSRVVTNTVRDEFNAVAFTNQNGSTNWSNGWQEEGDGAGVGPGAGDVTVENVWSANQLRIDRNSNGAWRQADLAGHTNASFSFDYRRLGLDVGEYVAVYASSNGGSAWVEIGRLNGAADDATTLSTNYDITPYIATNTAIRFLTAAALANNEGAGFDNVQIRFAKTLVQTNALGSPPALASGYTLAPGEALTITFQVIVTNLCAVTQIVNTASVTSDRQPVPVEATVRDAVASTDVGVFKTVNAAAVLEGDTNIFMIVVTNNGPSAATGLVVSDLLPAGFTNVGFSVSQGAYAATNGEWAVGTLAAGGAATLTLQARVLSGTSGSILTNSARLVRMGLADRDPSNNESSSAVTVQGADLALAKSASDATPIVGTAIAYTIGVSNRGPSAASGVVVTDAVPSGVTFTGYSASQGSYVGASGLWTVGPLAVGGTAILTLTGTVQAGAAGLSLTNTASLVTSAPRDYVATNNTARAVIVPRVVPVAISKSATPNPVDPGSNITYTITISNSAAIPVTGISVADVAPTGTTFVAGSCVVTAPVVTNTTFVDRFGARTFGNNDGSRNWAANWTDSEGDGAVAGDVQVRFDNIRGFTYSLRVSGPSRTVSRPADLGGFTNAVLSFDYRADGLEAGEYAAVQASTNGTSWTELARFDSLATNGAYASTSINIRAYISTNTSIRFATGVGTMDATDVVWFDDVQISAWKMTNTFPGGVPPAVATGYSLQPGQSMAVVFQARVDSPTTRTQIVNTASVTNGQMGFALSAAATTDVSRADLEVIKTANEAYPGTNEIFWYTVLVTNRGPHTATQIRVRDYWPSTSVTFIAAVPSTGTYDASNPTSHLWSINVLTAGSFATVTLTGRVNRLAPGVPITNTAAVASQVQYDGNPDNNTSRVTVVTAAVLARFDVFDDSGRVAVEWETASESGTAGFWLERQDGAGDWGAAGSGFVPALPDALQGAVYRVADAGAPASRPLVYRLTEVEMTGGRRVFGPFTVTPAATASGRAPPDAASVTPLRSDDMRVRLDRKRAADRSAPAPTRSPSPAVALGLTPAALKVGVPADGLYRVGVEAIAAALGAGTGDVAALIAGGVAVRQGTNDLPVLAADAAGVSFYAAGLDSVYSTTGVCWIEWRPGRSAGAADGGAPAPVPPGTFTDTIHIERDLYALNALFADPESDYWMGDYFIAGSPVLGSRAYTVALDRLASSGTAKLAVRVVGATSSGIDPEHHVSVVVNGAAVGEDRWSGVGAHDVVATFDSARLTEGDNVIAITARLDSGVPYSTIYLDAMDLSFPRRIEAAEDRVAFRAEAEGVVTVGGFSAPSVDAFDVSDAANAIRLTDVTIDESAGRYRASFHAAKGHAYAAAAAGAMPGPAWVAADVPSDLRAATNAADYLVITVPELECAARELSAYRASRGLRAQVVRVEDICDEFSAGVTTPGAIRDFLTWARAHWARPPRYAVLAGAGTYDYRNLSGTGENLVPTLMVPTPHGLFASDTALADADGDGVPELAIGRLPALTDAELLRLVNKIKGYEAAPDAPWQRVAVFVADDADAGGDFAAASAGVAGLMAGGVAVRDINLTGQAVSQARADLLAAWGEGALFANYFGHAGPDRLAAEGLLTGADAAALPNAGRLPVLTAMSCAAGQFPIPGYDCLAERLLLATNGAIAAWAPSGLSLNEPAAALCGAFYARVFRGGETVLGPAIRSAVSDYAAAKRTKYLPGIYNLLGDPATRLGGLPGGLAPDACSYEDWRRQVFTATESGVPAVSGDAADPDRDGLANLVEYALGRNPRGFDADRVLADLVDHALAPGYDGTVRFSRRKGLGDVVVELQVASDLLAGGWTAGVPYTLQTDAKDDGNGLTETLTYLVRSPDGDGWRCFARLVVRRVE